MWYMLILLAHQFPCIGAIYIRSVIKLHWLVNFGEHLLFTETSNSHRPYALPNVQSEKGYLFGIVKLIFDDAEALI